MLQNQLLEDGYQRYLSELQVAGQGQKVRGDRELPGGKIKVPCRRVCLFRILVSVYLQKAVSKFQTEVWHDNNDLVLVLLHLSSCEPPSNSA